jgi:hypothetical protein
MPTSELILIITDDNYVGVRSLAAARELDIRIPARPWWSIDGSAEKDGT